MRSLKIMQAGILSIVVLVFFGSFFIGCGPQKSEKGEKREQVDGGEVYPENGLPKNKKVTLNMIFPMQGYGKEYFQYGIETFQKRFPNVKINVRWIDSGLASYGNIIRPLFQTGNDDEMYDWFYGVYDLPALVKAGKLEQQDDLWERTLYDRPHLKVKDVVLIERREYLSSDEHIYTPPLEMMVMGLYYNKKMFRDNGWDEKPKDWHAFVNLCAKIKAKGIWPMVMAGKYPNYFTYAWWAIPYEVGGDKYRNDEYFLKPNVFISQSFLTMLKRMEDFAHKSYFHPGTISFDHTQSQMEFLQNKAAMIPNGTWIANEMKDVLPDGFEWGFMPFPGNDKPEQQKVVLVAPGANGYIWKNKPELNKKWTKEFNLWMLNLDIQKILAENGAIPICRDFGSDPKQMEGFSPSAYVALEAIKEAGVRTINRRGRARIIENVEMVKLDTVINNGFIEIIGKGKSAQQVAKDINRQYMKGLAADKSKD